MEYSKELLEEILSQFGIEAGEIIAHGTGLINNTWKINTLDGAFILQRINDNVFRKPWDIAFNLQKISDYLHHSNPGYLFTAPIKTLRGEGLSYIPEMGYFRVLPFVENSLTYTVAETPEAAYQAAMQFGKFTYVLNGFDATILRATIPDFHNLSLRYHSFEDALKCGNKSRIEEARTLIKELLSRKSIAERYRNYTKETTFKVRVTHHDTKISNVLFDKQGKGLCVIDLDTVMAGYFFSDVGDMMRTYLSPVSEEEKDFDKIIVRKDYYKAIVDGYNEFMGELLSKDEQDNFKFSGLILIYMQAIRFITDYLLNDIYYGAKYEKHNFVRAGNQLKLLQELEKME